jgi:hypothetical protein
VPILPYKESSGSGVARRCDEIAAWIEQLRDWSRELADCCPRGLTTEEVAKAHSMRCGLVGALSGRICGQPSAMTRRRDAFAACDLV